MLAFWRWVWHSLKPVAARVAGKVFSRSPRMLAGLSWISQGIETVLAPRYSAITKSESNSLNIVFTKYKTPDFGTVHFATFKEYSDPYSVRIRNAWKIEPQTRLAISLLGNESTFIDLGANVGTICLPIVIKTGARCYAVEADGLNVQLLEAAIKKNKLSNVHVIHCAVYDKDGQVSIAGSSGYVTVTDGGPISVPALTLDSIIEEYSIARVSLMKMDVEGCELKVLKGAEIFFKRNPDVDVIFEANGSHCLGAGYMPQDLMKYFEERDYSLYMIFGTSLIKRTSRDFQEPGLTDYIATKKRIEGTNCGLKFREMAYEERVHQVVRALTLMKPGYRTFMLKQLESAPREIIDDHRVSTALQEQI